MARAFHTREEYEAFARAAESTIVRFGDWTFDPIRLIVREPGLTVTISHREGEVLNALIDALPLPVRAPDIARQAMIGRDDVKVVIRRLRRKIGRERILTNAGGYQFVPFLESE